MGFREARKRAGKTVLETAQYMGVSHAAVCYWESGETSPTAAKLPKLAAFYGCTIDDLLSDNDSVPKQKSDKTD